MFKGLLLSAALVFSSAAFAGTSIVDVLVAKQQQAIMSEAHTMGLNWAVGDTNNYNINAGFIKGTMVMAVREKVAEGYWLNQDMDLGFAGKQKVEVLIDQNDGHTIKMIVNGKEQTPPSADDIEIIDITEDHVTVPAGSFDAVHVKARMKKDNSELNQWANPKLIPIGGMLKTVTPSQIGEVTVELTSFKKN